MDLEPLREQAEEAKPKLMVKVREATKAFLALPKTRVEVMVDQAVAFEMNNERAKYFTALKDKQYRDVVDETTTKYGIEDVDGNKKIVTDICTITKSKRTSSCLNTVAAQKLLEEKGLLDACTQSVVVVQFDEAKIIEAYQADLISAAELEAIFDDKVSYALQVRIKKGKFPEYDTLKAARIALEKGESDMPEVESGDI